MDYSGECEGYLLVNGLRHEGTVSVMLSERHGLWIRCGGEAGTHGPRATIYLFRPEMLFTQAWDHLRDGCYYELGGTRIGGIQDGGGRLLDGDYNYWTMRSVRIDICYFTDKITVIMTGEPHFAAAFAIPRSHLQALFEPRGEMGESFLGLIDKHCNASA